MITKDTDFVGRFAIANATDIEPNNLGNNEEVKLFIDEFEPECLVTVLGYSLYEELKSELLKQPFIATATETADQKWIDLVDGKDNYKGLLLLLVPYIFFKFLENDNEHYTGVGIVKENPKGAVVSPARKKAVTAWRSYYKWAVGTNDMFSVLTKNTIKGNVTGIIYGSDDDKHWSLYNFLDKNNDVYPNWSPSKISNINIYGI